MLRLLQVDPDSADARRLIGELDAALAALAGESGAASFDPQDCRGPGACFILAHDAQGTAVGCGAVRALDGDIGEVKRMYARPGSRAGAQILAELEQIGRASCRERVF